MKKKLLIYDNTGFVIQEYDGVAREPKGGVQFIWVDIPKGKRIKYIDGIGVDVSVTPHQVILEDIPPTEIEIQQEIINTLGKEITDIKIQMLLGGK